ncbi:MAG: inner membrane protein YpjD [Capsulimonadaceae bacterium]
MILSESALTVLAAVGYLIAGVAYSAFVLLRTPRLAWIGRWAAVVGVAGHTAAIGIHCSDTHRTPLLTPGETLSASAWAIVLVYVVLDFTLKQRPAALGAVSQAVAFLCLFAGAVLHRTAHGRHVAATKIDDGLISLHIVAILFAFGLLVLAFGCAVLYLAQHRMLKKKRSGGLFGKLPPLAAIERLSFGLVSFAFPLLTLGILAGAIRAVGGGLSHGWLADPIVLLSEATWLVYGLYLCLHVLADLRGPRAAYLLIGGLIFALATYFVPSAVHRFG